MYEVWMDDLNDYILKPQFSEVRIEKISNKSFSSYCIVLESCLKRSVCFRCIFSLRV